MNYAGSMLYRGVQLSYKFDFNLDMLVGFVKGARYDDILKTATVNEMVESFIDLVDTKKQGYYPEV